MDKGKSQIPEADDEGFIEVNSPSNKGNGSFSISNSFDVLNVDSLITKEVATGSKGTTSNTKKEGYRFVLLIEMINVIEKHILEGKLVLVDDDEKQLQKVDYSTNSNNDDEV
ncbi:hypothetical protein Tco_0212607 [Tanacetum coccineum]